MRDCLLNLPLGLVLMATLGCSDTVPGFSHDGGLGEEAQRDSSIFIRLFDGSTDAGGAADVGPLCSNATLDEGESDVDCGGDLCSPCDDGRRCEDEGDCRSGLCVDASCRAACSVWRTTSPTALYDSSVDGSGTRIFSVGNKAEAGYLAEFDGCGQLVQENTHLAPGMAPTIFKAVDTFDDDHLFVAGEASLGDGGVMATFGRFSRANLDIAAPLVTVGRSLGHESIFRVAHAGQHAFMAATIDWRATTQRGWALSAAPDSGDYCDFVLHDGQAMGVRAVGSDIYFIGQQEGNVAVVERISAASCTPPTCSPAGCAASWRVTHQVEDYPTKAHDAVVVRYQGADHLYVAGFYIMPATPVLNAGAFIARIRLDDPTQRKVFIWTPSPRVDGFNSLVSDGQALYLAANKNHDPNTGESTAVLKAVDLDLQPLWETTLTTEHGLSDVELVGSDGLLVTGGNTEQSLVARCTRDGICAP